MSIFKFKLRQMKPRKKISIFIFGALTILMIGFQNCSKTSFSQVDSVGQASIATGGFIPIDVSGNKTTTSEPIKLVLLVDTSYSMKDNLPKLKQSLAKFLEQNKQQAFDLFLYGITPNSGLNFGTNRWELLPPIYEAKVRSDNSASAIQQIGNYLQGVMNSTRPDLNETYEAGLCGLVRIVKQSNKFKSTDRVAIMFFSDEDDSLEQANVCPEMRRHNPAIAFYGEYKNPRTMLWARFNASGRAPTDGGIIVDFDNRNKDVYSSGFLISVACSSPGVDCGTSNVPQSMQCTDELKNHLKQAYPQGHPNMVINDINICLIEVTVDHGSLSLGGLMVSELRTLAGQKIDNPSSELNQIMAGTTGFKFRDVAYTNINDYLTKELSNFKNISVSFQNEAYPEDVTFSELANTQNKSANYPLIMDLINHKFPNADNLVLDFIIDDPAKNPVGCSREGNVIGQSYLDFVAQANRPDKFRTDSICDEGYERPFKHIATSFLNLELKCEYDLVGYNANNMALVKHVMISSKDQIKELLSDEYTIDQANKSVRINVCDQLKEGDKIILSE